VSGGGRLQVALDEGIARLSRAVGEEIERAKADAPALAGYANEDVWLTRVRAGLVGLLGFLDDEPAWTQLLFVWTAQFEAAGYENERRALAPLRGLLEELPARLMASELLSELTVGGVAAVIRGQVLDVGSGSLVELASSLAAFIASSYLGQARASTLFADRPGGELTKKRLPAATEVAFMPATGARSIEGRWSRQAVLSQTSDICGSLTGGSARRSIVNREDKGVVDK
jgi:hypothetical protein